jgi:hypothetical protein
MDIDHTRLVHAPGAAQFLLTDLIATLPYDRGKLGSDCVSPWQDIPLTPSSRVTSTPSTSATPNRPQRIRKYEEKSLDPN